MANIKKSTASANFLIYLSSRLISDLGSSVFSFALSLYVLDITGSATLFTVIVGFSYFISGTMEIFLKYNKTVGNKDGKSYFESFRKVWSYLNGEKVLKTMLFIIVILNCIMTPMVTVVLQYVNYHELKVSGSELSLIQASWSLGIIIGAVFVSTRKSVYGLLRKFLVFIQVQAVMITLWFIFKLPYFTKIDQAQLKITVAFCSIMFVAGIFNGFSSISAMSFIQTDTPEDILAGIVGIVNASQIAVPIGMWVYGVLLEKVPWVYDTVISGNLLFLIAGFVNLKIDLKGYFVNKEVRNNPVSKEHLL